MILVKQSESDGNWLPNFYDHGVNNSLALNATQELFGEQQMRQALPVCIRLRRVSEGKDAHSRVFGTNADSATADDLDLASSTSPTRRRRWTRSARCGNKRVDVE